MRIGSKIAFSQAVSLLPNLIKDARADPIIQAARITAIWIPLILAAWTHITPPTPSTQTTASVIPGIGSGIGSFATSHLLTGKSTSPTFQDVPKSILQTKTAVHPKAHQPSSPASSRESTGNEAAVSCSQK
jgi:hypothetical protein